MATNLIEASLAGNVQALQQLLADDPLLLHNAALASGDSPLHAAFAAGHVDFVRHILDLKPDFAQERNSDGFGPMHVASANGYLEIVKKLLEVDHNLSQLRGRDDWTPVHYAARRGRVDIIREMVSACPESLGDVTVQGETAIALAVKNNQFEAIRVLLDLARLMNKLDILNMKDNLGNTVLHLATWKKQHKVVEWLVGVGTAPTGVVEVNNVNESGHTALDLLLFFPSEAGDRETEEILRGAGALRAREIIQPSPDVLSSNQSQNNQMAPETHQEQPTNNVAVGALEIELPASNHDQMAPRTHQGQPNNVDSTALNIVDSVSNEIIDNQSQNQTQMASRIPQEADVEYFKFNKDRDKADDARTALLVVAVLVATTTYQVALNPPGGLWSDTNLSKNGTEPPHLAGTSNIASYFPVYSIIGAVLNSIGFSVSLHMIYILTTNFPLRLELEVCGLALYITYINGLITISPGETAGWYSLFALTPLLPPVVLFAAKRVRKPIIRVVRLLVNWMHPKAEGENRQQ